MSTQYTLFSFLISTNSPRPRVSPVTIIILSFGTMSIPEHLFCILRPILGDFNIGSVQRCSVAFKGDHPCLRCIFLNFCKIFYKRDFCYVCQYTHTPKPFVYNVHLLKHTPVVLCTLYTNTR